MSAMRTLLTRRNLILMGVAVLVLGLIAALAWTAVRGGKASITGQEVQRIVASPLLEEWTSMLDVTQAEASELYETNQLEEDANAKGVSKEELVAKSRAAIVDALDEAVKSGEITAEQAERALRMATRAVTNHL